MEYPKSVIHPPELSQYLANHLAGLIANRWTKAGYYSYKQLGKYCFPAKRGMLASSILAIEDSILEGVKYEPDSNGVPLPVIESQHEFIREIKKSA